mmetsp:Transcript_7889/g.12167  ORF Transcript_7889/g.12167 Transcript_7889/m.12167 type:complete len:151 (+) Transcript_7889:137-589(+)|eukprot:CAMPEP_0118703826 /NCGR_PEP_ID=MMETSP0800-20121206/18828_1 /TAXON_ID=210618 ORGANISM="Striatella unipunctata, Strain CCMP2910" /NCGR_SAMPLE_ID=MMETSP0800 /ASSEMBLY_ACC=CAM_ASM_000638 /LENGTH=150 /DNA_ID=CAMNT_0006605513 /DNA_START=166 /DNA_END=618 /DNA_ORIENTATION=-
MSRAFHPPDTLSKEDIRTLADVRRDIWTNGFIGMGTGSVGCLAMHEWVRIVHTRFAKHQKDLMYSRNTSMLSFLFGASLGGFVMATTTGKNVVHNLHPIFNAGAKTAPVNNIVEQRKEQFEKPFTAMNKQKPQKEQQERGGIWYEDKFEK